MRKALCTVWRRGVFLGKIICDYRYTLFLEGKGLGVRIEHWL